MWASLLLVAGAIVSGVNAVDWQPGNWAFACDFRNNDLTNIRISGEQCGGSCSQNRDCTHFTWTKFNGGTCWMKKGNVEKEKAFDTGDRSMVCGIVKGGPVNPGNPGTVHENVLATRHDNGGGRGDACALPQANYVVTNPFALGDVGELGDLKFRPELCGHVFQINCGHGPLNIIVTNSNLGGGLDLYSQTSWPKATANAPPGETRCSVQLSGQNAMSGNGFQCYYKPGTETNNAFFRNIGILNTGSAIVTGATLGGVPGNHLGPNPFYAFTGRFINENEEVVFTFNDGSSRSVRFRDCRSVNSEQAWV